VEFLAYSGEEYVIDCDILTHNNDIVNSEKLSPIIYPNPSNNEFTLILNDDDYISGQITIFDITGKTVLSECANKMEQIINVSNLKSGIYTVQIIKENRIKILKLILRN
jgi:small nuclear ribonucleoprotein (snRNP)-like protein